MFQRGYTRLPKERATGSFSVVTTKELAKRPSPEYHESFEGVVRGLRGCQEFGYDFLYGSDVPMVTWMNKLIFP